MYYNDRPYYHVGKVSSLQATVTGLSLNRGSTDVNAGGISGGGVVTGWGELRGSLLSRYELYNN